MTRRRRRSRKGSPPPGNIEELRQAIAVARAELDGMERALGILEGAGR